MPKPHIRRMRRKVSVPYWTWCLVINGGQDAIAFGANGFIAAVFAASEPRHWKTYLIEPVSNFEVRK